MTIEERLEQLERENKELKEMLLKVAELAYFAYNDMQFSISNTESEVYSFIRKNTGK